MKVEIDLEYRVYNDIANYCEANHITIEEYLLEIITEKHSINKFGDLNELLPKAIEESKVEVKKRGRKKKTEEVVTSDEIVKPSIPEPIKIDTKIEPKEDKVETTETKVEEQTVVKPTVKRTRKLKTL